MANPIEYVKCPYCKPECFEQGRKRPHWYKAFEVRITSRNVLIFKCLKCSQHFYFRFVGAVLTSIDMRIEEREVRKIELAEQIVDKEKSKEDCKGAGSL